MEKNTVFGELLYVGFVCEKGRCRSSGLWKYGYKKVLTKHIFMLKKILICMSNQIITEEDVQTLKCFLDILEEEKEIGNYYPISQQKFVQLKESNYKVITYVDSNKKFVGINNLMILLTDELLGCLNKKIFIDKKNVHMLLRALHNLPRVYLDKSYKTLCNLGLNSITSDEAFEYTMLNMSNEAKNKYINYLPSK